MLLVEGALLGEDQTARHLIHERDGEEEQHRKHRHGEHDDVYLLVPDEVHEDCSNERCLAGGDKHRHAKGEREGKAGKRDGVGEDSEHQERAEDAVINGERQHMGFVVGFVGVVRHDDSS